MFDVFDELNKLYESVELAKDFTAEQLKEVEETFGKEFISQLKDNWENKRFTYEVFKNIKDYVLKSKEEFTNKIFNDPRIKPLVEKGFIKPIIILPSWPTSNGITLRFPYAYFGGDFISHKDLSQAITDDGQMSTEYVWGCNNMNEAINLVITEMAYSADPENENDFETRYTKAMQAEYDSGRYQGD